MERMQAITTALDIIATARAAVYGNSPAAWEFLWHVTRYLNEQQKQAFHDVFQDLESSDNKSGLSALAHAITASGSAEEAKAQFDSPVLT